MASVRLSRSLLYILIFGTLGTQIVLATGELRLLPFVGALIVVVLSWGSKRPVGSRGGFGVAAGVTLAGPFLWVAYVICLFVFVYVYTLVGTVTSAEWHTSPDSRQASSEFLEFLRKDLQKAVESEVLPKIRLRAVPYWIVSALLAGVGGLVGAAVTRAPLMGTMRAWLDRMFLHRRERESETWDAQADEGMAERAAELMKAGFSQEEARSLVLKEWRDPALSRLRERERPSDRP